MMHDLLACWPAGAVSLLVLLADRQVCTKSLQTRDNQASFTSVGKRTVQSVERILHFA